MMRIGLDVAVGQEDASERGYEMRARVRNGVLRTILFRSWGKLSFFQRSGLGCHLHIRST